MSYDPNPIAARTAAWNKSRQLSQRAQKTLARSRTLLERAAHHRHTEPTDAARKAAAAARVKLEDQARGRCGWEYRLFAPGRHDEKGGEYVAVITSDRKRTVLLRVDHRGVLNDGRGNTFVSPLEAALLTLRMP
jgi:hypothetical protein